jgi:hypothetical protein
MKWSASGSNLDFINWICKIWIEWHRINFILYRHLDLVEIPHLQINLISLHIGSISIKKYFKFVNDFFFLYYYQCCEIVARYLFVLETLGVHEDDMIFKRSLCFVRKLHNIILWLTLDNCISLFSFGVFHVIFSCCNCYFFLYIIFLTIGIRVLVRLRTKTLSMMYSCNIVYMIFYIIKEDDIVSVILKRFLLCKKWKFAHCHSRLFFGNLFCV